MKVGDLVRARNGCKMGTVIEIYTDTGVPDACSIFWQDGSVSSIWQCDVEAISESR